MLQSCLPSRWVGFHYKVKPPRGGGNGLDRTGRTARRRRALGDGREEGTAKHHVGEWHAPLVEERRACGVGTVATGVGSVKADYILVEKSKRRLTLIARGRVLKSYRIALGRNPKGPKVREGDNRTPEGRYVIDYRLRDSDYHLALHISYPNRYDRERARRLGVSPGGDIMIHGIGSAAPKVADLHPLFDWTNGCIAVTDREIEEIWRLTAVGTVVNIVP